MKKINKLLLLILVLISIGCSSKEIKRIDILFVDPEIETPYRIQCNEFEKFFKDDLDSVSIKDDVFIEQFSNELNKLEKADITKYSLPDTRIKIKLIYENQVVELCIDRFVLSRQEELLTLSETIKKMINKEISKK